MKPKNKFQKRIVELAKRIKPITPAQKKWGIANCLEKRAVITKKTAYCLECGSVWERESSENVSHIVCPDCDSKLTKVEGKHRKDFQAAYYAILTIVEDLQVVRMFFVRKFGKVGKPAESSVMEVMQHWITEEGNFGLISCPTNLMSGFTISGSTEGV